MPKRGWFILSAVALFIFMSLFVFYRIKGTHQKKPDCPLFPSWVATDIRGEKLDSGALSEKFIFVQVGDLRLRSDRMMLNKVLAGYKGKLAVLAVMADPYVPDEFRTERNMRFVYDHGSRIRKLFNVPEKGSYYLLYDVRRKLVGSGNIQAGFENGPKIVLDEYIENRTFGTNLIIPEAGRNIDEYSWLGQIKRHISTYQHKFFLIGLFSSICESCPSGSLISLMKDIHSQADVGLGILAIVSPDFKPEDVAGLISQLSIMFPVEIADSPFGQRWKDLEIMYAPSELNDILLLLSRSGNIVFVSKRSDQISREELFKKCLELSGRR